MNPKIILATIAFALSIFAQAQIKQDRTVSNFSSIEVSGAFKVFLRMGDECALTVVADKDIIDDVEHNVSEGELEIELERDWWDWNSDAGEIELYITVKNLSGIELSGACSLNSKNTLRGKNIDLDITGASKLHLDVNCSNLDIELSGATKVNLKGKCTKINIEASGASAIYAADLQAENVNLEASGACKAEVNASEYLDIEASGASKVRYKGNPRITQETSGASDVSAM